MLVRRRFSQSKTHLRVIVVTGRSCVLPIAFGALITAPATLDPFDPSTLHVAAD